jgi:uncharacterized membrane protein YeaQ/YmgE (transglycosylase-associated protein family)
VEGWIISLLLGTVAGWLVSQIFKGSSLGLLGDILVCIVSRFIGYWLLGKLGVSLGSGWFGYILTAAIGAIVLLAVLNPILKKR